MGTHIHNHWFHHNLCDSAEADWPRMESKDVIFRNTYTHEYIYMYIHTCYRDINIHTYTHLLYIYITIIGKHNYLTPNIYNQNRRLKVFITSTPTWDFIFAIFKKPGQDTAARNYQPGKKCKVLSVSALRPSWPQRVSKRWFPREVKYQHVDTTGLVLESQGKKSSIFLG